MNAIERNLVLLRLHGLFLHEVKRGGKMKYFFSRTPVGSPVGDDDYMYWYLTNNRKKKTAIHLALLTI